MSHSKEPVIQLFRSYTIEEIEERHGQVAMGIPKGAFRGHDSSQALEN